METWLKLRSALLDSPKVLLLARLLKVNVMTARGIAWTWLDWIDRQTTDGNTELSAEEINLLLGFRGAAEALVQIGWLAQGSDGSCSAVEFGKHCGESAKQRALHAMRQSKYRKSDGDRVTRDANSVTSDASTVTQVTHSASPRNRIREEYSTNMSESSTTVVLGNDRGETPSLSSFEESFSSWLAALCSAVPAFMDYAKLPEAVEEAARRAYEEMPDAVQYVALLTAYYASKRSSDDKGKTFWRPTGALFFAKLGDVVHNHAERWARETGWGKKPKPKPKPKNEPVEVATEAEKEEFRAGNRALLGVPDQAQVEQERYLANQRAIAALARQLKGGGA